MLEKEMEAWPILRVENRTKTRAVEGSIGNASGMGRLDMCMYVNIHAYMYARAHYVIPNDDEG